MRYPLSGDGRAKINADQLAGLDVMFETLDAAGQALPQLPAHHQGTHQSAEGPCHQQIVSGLASQVDVALARLWLIKPGDICEVCPRRSECPQHVPCLHLAASAGRPREDVADLGRVEKAGGAFGDDGNVVGFEYAFDFFGTELGRAEQDANVSVFRGPGGEAVRIVRGRVFGATWQLSWVCRWPARP